jgi:hypothetical protein
MGIETQKQREKKFFSPCELAGIVGVRASEKVFGLFYLGPHPLNGGYNNTILQSLLVFFYLGPHPLNGGYNNNTILQSLLDPF